MITRASCFAYKRDEVPAAWCWPSGRVKPHTEFKAEVYILRKRRWPTTPFSRIGRSSLQHTDVTDGDPAEEPDGDSRRNSTSKSADRAVA